MNKAFILSLGLLTACAHAGQNDYNEFDVGKDVTVEFGTIISERSVDITAHNTGGGALIGGGAGLAAGSQVGHGGQGTAGAELGGLIVGAIVGAIIEQHANNHKGMEYIITLHNKKTISIVQNINDGDVPLHPSERVMVQTSGIYHRVLPADNMPEKIRKPKQIEVQ